MKTEELTTKQFEQFGEDIYKLTEYANRFRLKYPDKPIKPRLDSKHTSEQLKEYIKAFEQYEVDMSNYEELKKSYTENEYKINSLIEEYIKDISGFNTLPEKVKNKVWCKALEDGHSSGYYQVYYELRDLIDLFY